MLRDGLGVLPTGRNIYALDPYRMPSKAALRRGQLAADRILDQHRASNDGVYPETVAVAFGVVISISGSSPSCSQKNLLQILPNFLFTLHH